ncbi:MAG TPA: 30S ribosomal protein S9 [Candidatus Omnitrophota bacterium]|nr:30S ribosomal protein S9 [Candidatus Omnitrophota bacterium]
MVENTKPLYATGRRKRSVARVWLKEGEKGFMVNGMDVDSYFGRQDLRMIVRQPFQALHLPDRFHVKASVVGGGIMGQAGAIRHGISRALAIYDQSYRSVLRKEGFLTRDPREKERKKFGRKGARRSFQYTKR